jgi:hypothetical protein
MISTLVNLVDPIAFEVYANQIYPLPDIEDDLFSDLENEEKSEDAPMLVEGVNAVELDENQIVEAIFEVAQQSPRHFLFR